ncbi:MAG: chalcone isomerase [Ketobacter sp.]|nr:MAG: chalcone isomerase [Ketobacter sp.]|tara:strand:+ start:403 stop:972 length:570 start_codon:yes stop_codon:yes gene_type:complete
MRKLGLMLILSLVAVNSYSLDIGGISLPDTMETKDHQKLVLNGAGIREKWFMDLYVGALYLTAPQSDSEKVVAADEPMTIRLHIISGMITSKKLTEATQEGFENSTHGNAEPILKEVNEMLHAFKEPIKNGDVFDFVYLPEEGVSIYKNNHEIRTIPCDGVFKEALFGIWLSDQPAQKSLKQDMMGSNS